MNEFTEFLKHYSPLVSLFSFLIGLYVGNRQAIGRDRRKEFNELAEPVIENFSEMKKWLEKQTFTTALLLPTANIEKLKRRLPARKRKKLECLLNKYRTSLQRIKESTHSMDGTVVPHEERINNYAAGIRAIEDLNRFLKLK